MVSERRDNRVDGLLHRSRETIDHEIRLRVDRVPVRHELRELGRSVDALEKRTPMRSAGSRHERIQIRAQPQRKGAIANRRPCNRIDIGAAAGGYNRWWALQQTGDHPPLAEAERRFAGVVEQLGDRLAGVGFDGVIRIDEGHGQNFGESLANARLSCAHQADKHDRAIEAWRAGCDRLGLSLYGLTGFHGAVYHKAVCDWQLAEYLMKIVIIVIAVIVALVVVLLAVLASVDIPAPSRTIEKTIPTDRLIH